MKSAELMYITGTVMRSRCGAFELGCGSYCLVSLFEPRQNADFRPELVVPAESHLVDHGFEVAVQAEDHAPLVEFAHRAAAGDLHAPLGQI
jgi:hypothetical protein